MTEVRTGAFPQVVIDQSGSGVLFVDSVSLINFDRIGSLDALLAAHRTILITPEVFQEAVERALTSPNPAVFASAQRIDSWIQAHSSNVMVGVSDSGRSLFSGEGKGESSMASGSNTLITIDANNSVLLQNVALGNLHVADFHIV